MSSDSVPVGFFLPQPLIMTKGNILNQFGQSVDRLSCLLVEKVCFVRNYLAGLLTP